MLSQLDVHVHRSCARNRLPQHQARRLLAALSPTPLLRTLGTAYVGYADANYGCRVLALQLLLEALRVISGTPEPEVGRSCSLSRRHMLLAAPGRLLSWQCVADRRSHRFGCISLQAAPIELDLKEALMECLYAVLANVSGGFAAAAAAAPVLARQPQASAKAARGADTATGAAAYGGTHGFAGKGAVRLAMGCLLHLTELLPAGEWTSCWQQVRYRLMLSCAFACMCSAA